MASSHPKLYQSEHSQANFHSRNQFETLFNLQGREPPAEPVKLEYDINENKRSHRVCELCDRVIIGDREWAGRMR